MDNLIRVATCVPKLKISNVKYNVKTILALAKQINSNIIVFPELSLTGYTCGDLFLQSHLISEATLGLLSLKKATKTDSDLIDKMLIVGMPVKTDNQLFNCAIYVYNGNILGVVPKTYIPNYNEFYEKRWFASSKNRLSDTVIFCDKEETIKVPFGEDLIFTSTDNKIKIATDICEDLWVSIPPSSFSTLYGANIIVNPSASNEIVSKKEYRKDIVRIQSAKCMCAYVYSSAGMTESTTDIVFSGHSIIANNGTIQKESIFKDNHFEIATIDIEKIENDRMKFNSYMGNVPEKKYRFIEFAMSCQSDINTDIKEKYICFEKHPFVPQNKEKRIDRCNDILQLQAIGLYQRLLKTNIKNVVLGLSGGLDSTLALLVCVKAFEMLGYSNNNIICVTMPAFGTTNRTYANAIQLAQNLNTQLYDINIKNACLQHFKDIGQDIKNKDITYENTQARERTQILMDMANMHNALVVGTGDLSELALGWCTYNGDHMSMYSVNSSIPKTLAKYLVETVALTYINKNINIYNILIDICDTPISPELLPPDKNGLIQQKTENNIGKYDLHDFFLYNMLRNGYSPKKTLMLAKILFAEIPEEEIIKTHKTFYSRFFSQQFKRSCLPDGVKVGSISLSPRGDFRMPSDANVENWIE